MKTLAFFPRQKWLTGLGLAGALALGGLAGCFAVAVGAGAAGTVAFVRGQLAVNLSHDYEPVLTATNHAIAQLQFTTASEKKDALGAVLIARTAQDKKVEIQLHKIGDQLTKVQIRVGVFGDESLSLLILDKIKANL